MPTSLSLGTTTVVALDDAEGTFFQPREEAFPGATAEHWRQADSRDPAAVRDGAWWLRFRCFAFREDDGTTVLVDTGVGPADAPARSFAPVPGRLPAELESVGIAPADIHVVVLTHLHVDHIGWSMDSEGKPYFPNARYVVQRTELEVLGERLASWLLDPLRQAGQLSEVDGQAAISRHLRVVPTPGHTPGHQSVLLETPDRTLVATGDLLVRMVQLVDPSLRYVHEAEPETARRSRMSLLAEVSRRGSVILATPHLSEPFISLGRSAAG